MLEIFFLVKDTAELMGSFIFGSQIILRAKWGTLVETPLRKIACYLCWLTPKKINCNFTQHLLFGPVHAWEGSFPSKSACCCHILLFWSSRTPRGFFLLCCQDAPYTPSANKQDRSQHTQQDTLNSPFAQSNFFPLQKIRKRGGSPPFVESHNSWASYRHGCSGYT